MPCTKDHIVNSIYNQLDLPKNTSIEIVESLLEIIKRTMANGEDVLVSGFGKFCVREKRGRRTRNPKTGQEMMLSPMRVVTFKWSRVLRDKLNG